MKIIIANIRYFVSGGPERYMFNITELLESQGHQVIPFSINHNRNIASDYSSYFLDSIGDGEEVYFHQYKKNKIKDILHLAGRLFYSFEAKKKISQLIKDTNPDLLYVLLYQNKISPSIINAAKQHNIPVVLRISDYGMICGANVFYLSKMQEICELCLLKGQKHLVKNKCVNNSFIYSSLKFMAFKFHDFIKIKEKIDAFIIPSSFTKSKFIRFGIPEDKIFHIPSFTKAVTENTVDYHGFVLYFGRIEPEKGIKTLVDAFIGSDIPLKIIGFSSSGYDEIIKKYLSDKKHAISFLGKMEPNEISIYLKTCSFTICSSECYDNFPNTILESYAFKKAVIATDIGSLKEIVVHGETGLLFEYKNSCDLKNKVELLIHDKERTKLLGQNGYRKLTQEYSENKHISKLISVFNSLI